MGQSLACLQEPSLGCWQGRTLSLLGAQAELLSLCSPPKSLSCGQIARSMNILKVVLFCFFDSAATGRPFVTRNEKGKRGGVYDL